MEDGGYHLVNLITKGVQVSQVVSRGEEEPEITVVVKKKKRGLCM